MATARENEAGAGAYQPLESVEMTQYLINGSAGLLARAPDVFSGTAPGGGVPDLKNNDQGLEDWR
jgi:hypothetical protein